MRALRISQDGPEFPGDFVDSLFAGEIVFLCGTGVSAPQMPDFRRLVKETYKTLGVTKEESERRSFEKERFEEVLGSLNGRLSDPRAVARTVTDLLAVPRRPDLKQHRTMLRLSRDLDNRFCLVTTNFDTLFERAVAKQIPRGTVGKISSAGQGLPAPGSASFHGIIHIHGRLGDNHLKLQSTPLVLTSADYGDAYMRSGWASRFLFELARCKSIILVGYSAGDAPVRYFLNVLEADRARFPDLRPVYAFDAYELDPDEAVARWGTLAVKLMPYCKVNSATGSRDDHSSLWNDLAALADIVDRPKQSRRDRVKAILKRPVAEADANARKELGWLFGGRSDLWSIALNVISDPSWFEVFQDDGLWSTEEAAWIIADWVAKKFEDRGRLECALEWQGRLGPSFIENIKLRLRQMHGMDETWVRIWRLFCLVEPVEGYDAASFRTQEWLASGVTLDSDLREAVRVLAPRLELNRKIRELEESDANKPAARLADVVWPRMGIPDPNGAEQLIETLCAMPNCAGRVLDLVTAELQSALQLECDLELIGEDYDENDFTVPSIEKHDQNEYREGVNCLVRVLAGSLSQAATLDRDHVRRVVTDWKSLPGRIGLRLCLHAMRDAELFDADEAMKTLLSLSDDDFWRIRREVAALLKDRAGSASPGLKGRVEGRVRGSGKAYYARYEIQDGEVDWRTHARDATVWLRLNMLRDAGVLSKRGATELSAIKKRRSYLDRAVEDQDYFGSYMSKAQFITGDPVPIMEAEEDDRLQVARQLFHSYEADLRHGWSAFCRLDPQGAFDSLRKEDLTRANVILWNGFLNALAFGDEASKPMRDALAVQVLDHLANCGPDALRPMVSGLVDLIYSVPREHIADVQGWLERLWGILLELEKEESPLDLSADLYGTAINSPEGRLAQTLLLGIEARREKGRRPTREQLRLLRSMAGHEGTAGQLARAELVRNLAFVVATNRQVAKTLRRRIRVANDEGAALRAVMLRYGPITPDLARLFRQAIIQGAIESVPSGRDGTAIASKVLRPALDEIRRNDSVQWGLTESDAVCVLHKAPQAIRIGALEVLVRWLRTDRAGAEEAWRLRIAPLFDRIWPKERKYRDVSLNPHLLDLAVGSGAEFPTALELLQPYMIPYDQGYGSLSSVVSSRAPDNFPRETLDLLWLVCGRGSRGRFHDIPKILDRLVAAEPELEIDRRLQWLENRAVRYD